MIRKSLKAIITSISVIAMLSSGMICSADEVTNVVAMANKKVSLATTVMTTTKNTSVTTTDITTSSVVTTTPIDTTTPEVTTSVETTTTAPTDTTTTQDTLISQAIIDLPNSNLQPITMSIDVDFLLKLPYEERLLTLQSKIDDYLYNNSVTPNEALVTVQDYLKSISIDAELNSKDVFYLIKYASNITTAQNKNIELNKKFYKTLEDIISSVNYKNYSSIETYCKASIKSAFKSGYLSSKEAINLTKSIHDTIMNSLSDWDLDLLAHYNYEFVSNQSLVNKWNTSYPDMKGWIFIQDNPIDYPLMQPPYEDNEYYLQHSWNGAESPRGTIELDYRCSLSNKVDSEDVTENVLIYGHNLSDNTMFSSLENYRNKSYWQEHQYIEISTDSYQRLYQIYAVCSIYGRADGTKFKYWDDKYLSLDKDTFDEHLKLTKENQYYDTGIVPYFGQDILTLQTCDTSADGWRIVVFAKRVK